MDCPDELDAFSDNEAVGPNTDEPLSPPEKAAEYDRLVLENQSLKVRLRKARSELEQDDDRRCSVSFQPANVKPDLKTSSTPTTPTTPIKVIDLTVAQSQLDKIMAMLHAESRHPHRENRVGHISNFLMALTLEVGRAQAAFNGAAFIPSMEKCIKLADEVGDAREALSRSENILGSVKVSYQSAIDRLEAKLKESDAQLQLVVKSRDAFEIELVERKTQLTACRKEVERHKGAYAALFERSKGSINDHESLKKAVTELELLKKEWQPREKSIVAAQNAADAKVDGLNLLLARDRKTCKDFEEKLQASDSRMMALIKERDAAVQQLKMQKAIVSGFDMGIAEQIKNRLPGITTERDALKAEVESLKQRCQIAEIFRSSAAADLQRLKETPAIAKICQLEAELKTLAAKAQECVGQTVRGDQLADELAEKQHTIEDLTRRLEDSQDIIAALQSIDEDRQRQSERNLFESRLKANNDDDKPLRVLVSPMPRTLAEAAEKSKKYGGK